MLLSCLLISFLSVLLSASTVSDSPIWPGFPPTKEVADLDTSILQPVLSLLRAEKVSTFAVNEELDNISPLPSADHWAYLLLKALELNLSEFILDNIISTPFEPVDKNYYSNLDIVTNFIRKCSLDFSRRLNIPNLPELLKDIIMKRPTNLNSLDYRGQNPLQLAIEERLPAAALTLIELGANGYPRDRTDYTPLQYIMATVKGLDDRYLRENIDLLMSPLTPCYEDRIFYRKLVKELIKIEARARYLELLKTDLDIDCKSIIGNILVDLNNQELPELVGPTQ